MRFSLRRPRYAAAVARERLQVLLAHERPLLARPDLLVALREEIMAVIAKHVRIETGRVRVKLDHRDSISVLEIDIEVPNAFAASLAFGSGWS
jgi:cell division topological specificity factor